MSLRARLRGQAKSMSTIAIVILAVVAVFLLVVIAYTASRPKRELELRREPDVGPRSERDVTLGYGNGRFTREDRRSTHFEDDLRAR